MNTMTRKVCVVCGKDVSQTKRTKDQQGRYYCNPCWATRVSRHQLQTAQSSGIDIERRVPNLNRERVEGQGRSTPPPKPPSTPSHVSSATVAHPRGTPIWQRLLRLATVAVVTIVAVTAVVYFTWLRPQKQQMDQTLAAAVVQSERTEAMSRELTQRQIEEVQEKLVHVTEEAAVQPPQPPAGPSAAEEAAKRKLAAYVGACTPFVREIKALRFRVGQGASYDDFSEKLREVGDAYAQIDDPPDNVDAAAFAAAAASTMEHYRKAESRWAFALRNNLFLAEKYAIREMFESADSQVGLLASTFDLMQTRVSE